MSAENTESCLRRDSAERKGYVRAHRSFNRIWKERDSAEPDILGKILEKDNLNRAYKRVKANKGAPGIDGMTVEEALPWLKEHNHELVLKITGKYRRGQPLPEKNTLILFWRLAVAVSLIRRRQLPWAWNMTAISGISSPERPKSSAPSPWAWC